MPKVAKFLWPNWCSRRSQWGLMRQESIDALARKRAVTNTPKSTSCSILHVPFAHDDCTTCNLIHTLCSLSYILSEFSHWVVQSGEVFIFQKFACVICSGSAPVSGILRPFDIFDDTQVWKVKLKILNHTPIKSFMYQTEAFPIFLSIPECTYVKLSLGLLLPWPALSADQRLGLNHSISRSTSLHHPQSEISHGYRSATRQHSQS